MVDGDETDDASIADEPPSQAPPRQLALRPLQPEPKPKGPIKLCKLNPPKLKKSKKDKDAELKPGEKCALVDGGQGPMRPMLPNTSWITKFTKLQPRAPEACL